MSKTFLTGPAGHFALFIALTLLSSGIFAGPPYQTDDPEPPEPGQCEIFFATHADVEADGVAGGFPQVEINYGVGGCLQLSLSPQMAYYFPRHGISTYGFGDIELAVKYRFLKETVTGPQAALFPRVVLPTGDQKRGLGDGNVKVFVPLWLQKSWGPWCMFGGGGYWFNPGPGNRNYGFAGAALQRDCGDVVSVGGELYFHSAPRIDDARGCGADLAFLWHLTKNNHLVSAMGPYRGNGRTGFACYLAFRKLL